MNLNNWNHKISFYETKHEITYDFSSTIIGLQSSAEESPEEKDTKPGNNYSCVADFLQSTNELFP